MTLYHSPLSLPFPPFLMLIPPTAQPRQLPKKPLLRRRGRRWMSDGRSIRTSIGGLAVAASRRCSEITVILRLPIGQLHRTRARLLILSFLDYRERERLCLEFVGISADFRGGPILVVWFIGGKDGKECQKLMLA